jgi:hypothetical protein
VRAARAAIGAAWTTGAICVAVALGACGGRGEASGLAGADLSTPVTTWRGAMRALEAGDLGALRPYLTAEAERRLCADLEAWRGTLVDPAAGPRVLSRLASRADLDPDLLRRALGGETEALLRVLVSSDPRPFTPLDPPPQFPRGAEVLYPVRDGSFRTVVLARDAVGWRVARLDP